jgi:fengycin family lipopeptide synthetase D
LKLQGEANRNPLFDTEFALNNIDVHDAPNIEIPGLRFEGYPWKTQFAKFDLHLLAFEINDTLHLLLRYYTALFKKTTAEKITKHYVEIIKQVVENPDMKLKDIEVSLNFLNVKSKALKAEQGDFEFYN